MKCFENLCCDRDPKKDDLVSSLDVNAVRQEEAKVDQSMPLGKSEVQLNCGYRSSPHPLKTGLFSANADAVIVSDKMVAVADGVSSVALEGIDVTRLPQELLTRCLHVYKSYLADPVSFSRRTEQIAQVAGFYYDPSDMPRYIVAQAFSECSEMGSTTLLIGFLKGSTIEVVNVGDSQMLQIRRYQYDMVSDKSSSSSTKSVKKPRSFFFPVIRTAPQQHSFNCPYQLTRMPDFDCNYIRQFKRTLALSEHSVHELQPGDVLLFGTDGVFDNLFDYELCRLTNEVSTATIDESSSTAESLVNSLLPHVTPAVLAHSIVEEAISAAVPPIMTPMVVGNNSGMDVKRITPFSQSVINEFGYHCEGGKPDDTSVVVCYVGSGKKRKGKPKKRKGPS